MTSFNIDDFRKADRKWDLEALIIFGNMNVLAEVVGGSNSHPALMWACAELNERYEDEMGWGYTLISENPQISDLVFGECQFGNGKELTGKLEEWIMNLNNEYQR